MTPQQEAAMQQALEALEKFDSSMEQAADYPDTSAELTALVDVVGDARKAITALHQALEQPARYPVTIGEGNPSATGLEVSWPEQPAQQEPDQRLVNLLCRIHRDGGHCIAEHGLDRAVADADIKVAELNAMSDANSQAREPLTDEDIEIIDDGMCGDREFAVQFARAIEAAHGIK